MKTRDKRRRRGYVKSRKAEIHYAAQLRKVAKQVGLMIDGFEPGAPASVDPITRMMERYARALDGWATRTGAAMLAEVNHRDVNAWEELSQDMSAALRRELRAAPTKSLMDALLAEQVSLIKSIPLDAAQRVADLTREGIADATRASEIAKAIMASGEVAKSRANLIARTEVARTASALTEARALRVESEGYIWRTSGDGDVRDAHKKMNGKFVRWDSPPTLSDGTTGHAGSFPNCRCYPEPVIPD